MVPDLKKSEILKQQEGLKQVDHTVDLPIDSREFSEKVEALSIPKPTEVKEKANDKKDDSFLPASKAQDAKQIKAQLLRNLPSDKIMIKEVDDAVSKGIKLLEKRKSQIIHNPISNDFHKLNIIIQKLRELRNVLVELAQATHEMLMNLWLKFVHGIH